MTHLWNPPTCNRLKPRFRVKVCSVHWLSPVTKAARSSLGFTKPGNNYAKWLCTSRDVCFWKKCCRQDTSSRYCCSLWFCPFHQESVCAVDWICIIDVPRNHSILLLFYLVTFLIRHRALYVLQNRVLPGNAIIAIFLKELTLLWEYTDFVKLSKRNNGNYRWS